MKRNICGIQLQILLCAAFDKLIFFPGYRYMHHPEGAAITDAVWTAAAVQAQALRIVICRRIWSKTSLANAPQHSHTLTRLALGCCTLSSK
jgi:hypothetical protein